jgi:hypothetical protein
MFAGKNVAKMDESSAIKLSCRNAIALGTKSNHCGLLRPQFPICTARCRKSLIRR